MAAPGHYKKIKSNHPLLEIKRAGKDHICAGVCIERGNRPGIYSEAWMIARTKRCCGTIKQNQFYIANRVLPPFFPSQMMWENWIPLCLYCAIEVYGDYIDGELKHEYMRPVTEETRQELEKELAALIREMERTSETTI